MISIERAAQDYGVTVERVPDADFTVKHFVLTGVSVACVLWFRIVNKQNQSIPGIRLMTRNGGDILTGPSKEDGYTTVGMGGGSAYFPAEGQSGPHSAWIDGATSDIVRGLGWDGSTDHQSLITIWEGEGGIEMPYELIGFGDLNLYDHFRNAGVDVYEDQKYGVTQLWGRSGSVDDKPFPFEVTVRRKSGEPAVGKIIKLKRDGGDSGAWDHVTDAQGCAIIYMDDDFRYAVPGDTHYSVQLGKGEGGSDVVAIGWVAKEKRWFDVVFQARGGEPQLPEKPTIGVVDTTSTSIELDISSRGALTLGYTVDGPDHHQEGEWTDPPATLSGLEPSTTYHLKVWGSNEAGDGPDTEFEFTTLEEQQGEVPPPVEGLRVVYATKVTLSLEWDESPGAMNYRVAVADQQYTTMFTNYTNYTVAGLIPDTMYQVSVAAGNSHGWSDWNAIFGKTAAETSGDCDPDWRASIEGKLNALLAGQEEGFEILFNKLSVAEIELPKITAELERISGECTCHE